MFLFHSGKRQNEKTSEIFGFLLSVLIAVFRTKHMMFIALNGLHQRSENTLGLASSALTGQLAHYEKLLALIAEHDTLQNLVREPAAENVAAVNQYLQSIINLFESSDIYRTDPFVALGARFCERATTLTTQSANTRKRLLRWRFGG